jgi:hypothetical protein
VIGAEPRPAPGQRSALEIRGRPAAGWGERVARGEIDLGAQVAALAHEPRFDR